MLSPREPLLPPPCWPSTVQLVVFYRERDDGQMKSADKELELAVISRETNDGEAKSDDIGNPEGEGEGETEAKVEVSLMREY